ncbi:hypothetical protein [Dyadobacter psychrotolerans]|uniref:Uncharacterized protein n=1 Tax=Dyadobacter psychrotolerans TaxID=2541721 RepID=A0A4R5DUE9_9BACT|nr:hypothetical protein [Dyadobacter psychrotolerans]TDE14825.1 hypothetical protein E0F88_16725 [Dyadobacter psychrotolerans]
MQNIDPVKYLKELKISDLSNTFPISRDLETKDLPTTEGIEQSFMNAKSIVSFVSEIDGQRRDDVLNSVLLAQLAANKLFPGDDQSLEWYKEFVNVLNNIGWNIQAAEFTHFESREHVFDIQNVIIDILLTAFGGTFIKVITKTLDAIKGLADSNGKITVFEKNTHSLSKGAFQIGLAKVENEAVSLQIGTFLITSSNEIKRILFFKTTKDKTSLDYCSRTGTLNEQIYATIRESVVEKLGGKVTEFIAEVEI